VAANAVITIVLVLMTASAPYSVYGKQKIRGAGPLQEDKVVNIPARGG